MIARLKVKYEYCSNNDESLHAKSAANISSTSMCDLASFVSADYGLTEDHILPPPLLFSSPERKALSPGGGGGGGGGTHIYCIRRLGPSIYRSPQNIRNLKHPKLIFEFLVTPKNIPDSVP